MTTSNLIRPRAAALLAAGAIAVAACGGEDAGGTTSSGDRESEARDAMLAYAECMRDHGVDVPDPKFGDGPVLQKGPDGSVPPAKLRDAEEACRTHFDDIEPPDLSEEEKQRLQDAALAHARCMREQGLESFPDPTFDEDGGARIRIDKGQGIDPDSPSFKRAQEACRDELPELEGRAP